MAAAGTHSLRSRIEQLLRVDSEAKPCVYREIFESAEIAGPNYWPELILSAGIATLGLVLNSPAVVIGAMLISPLMGPITAAGLVWLLPFQTPNAEILTRAFRARLGADRLRLVLEQQALPAPQAPGRKASPKKGARR